MMELWVQQEPSDPLALRDQLGLKDLKGLRDHKVFLGLPEKQDRSDLRAPLDPEDLKELLEGQEYEVRMVNLDRPGHKDFRD